MSSPENCFMARKGIFSRTPNLARKINIKATLPNKISNSNFAQSSESNTTSYEFTPSQHIGTLSQIGSSE
jgi:hypothetical protein